MARTAEYPVVMSAKLLETKRKAQPLLSLM